MAAFRGRPGRAPRSWRSGGSQPVAGAPLSGNDLLSLAIEGVVSSAALLGGKKGLAPGPMHLLDDPSGFDEQPAGPPLNSAATVILGPIAAPLEQVADYVRAKYHTRVSLF